jgi:hypothetical protein
MGAMGAVPHFVGSNEGQHASVEVPSLIHAYPFAQQPLPQQPPVVQHWSESACVFLVGFRAGSCG